MEKIFSLNSGIYLATGALNAALYDTNTGDIFAVDSGSRAVLEELLSGSIKEDPSVCNPLLAKLEEKGLGRFYEPSQLPQHQLPEKPEPKIDFVWFELTNGCNLQCRHCYNSSGKEAAKNYNKPDLLQQQEWQRLIDETAQMGIKSVQFIGGEPFIYSQLMELVEYASAKINFVEIFTNATMMRKEDIDKIAKLGVHVGLSLYGNTPEVHDNITQNKGSFERTTSNLKLLRESGVGVRVALIAMSLNEEHIAQTQKYVSENFGIKNVRYDIVRPVGRGIDDSLVPKSLYEQRLAKEASFSKVDSRYFARNFYGNPCFQGKICIGPVGKVYPCIMEKEEQLGNVKENTLQEILAGDSLQRVWGLSKDQIDGCKDCEYRYACHDCRPKAKKESNYFAKPDDCLYDPLTGKWEGLKHLD